MVFIFQKSIRSIPNSAVDDKSLLLTLNIFLFQGFYIGEEKYSKQKPIEYTTIWINSKYIRTLDIERKFPPGHRT